MEKFNCPNCGAPITEERCPFCGTVFLDFAALQLGAPCYVKIKTEHGYLIVRIVITELNIEANTEEYTYHDGIGAALMSRVFFNGYDLSLRAHTVYDDKLRHITLLTQEAEK